MGSTNLRVSRIGLGGFAFCITPKKDVEKAINRALDLGINYFDNARLYGSENKVGSALKGRRDRVIIASKCHFRDKKDIRKSLEKTLKELKTDYLDVYHIHEVKSEAEFFKISEPGGVLDLYEEFRREGKIRFIGASGHNNQALVRAVKSGRVDVVMGRYNPITRDIEDSVIPATRKFNRGYIVISALAWGIFSVPVKTHPFLLGERAVPAAVASFRYILSNPGVDVVLAGVRSAGEVEELVSVLDYEPLSVEEKALVVFNSLALGRGSGCTQCGVCMPCPEGIDIPLYYRYLTYIKEYQTYEYPALTWQAYAEPFSKACTDCGICVERCPFDLPIPKDIRRVDALVEDIRHPTYKDEYD